MESQTWHILQLSMVMGKKPKDIKVGDSFDWYNVSGKISNIAGDQVTIHLGSTGGTIITGDVAESYTENVQREVNNPMHPLDMLDDQSVEPLGPSDGFVPFKRAKPGDMSPFGTPATPEVNQGEVAGQGEKSFTWPNGELKEIHPPLMRNSPAPDEPHGDVRYSKIDDAREMLAIFKHMEGNK